MKKTILGLVIAMVMVGLLVGCTSTPTIGEYDSDLAGGSLYTPRGWEKVSTYNIEDSIAVYKEQGIYGLTLKEL